MDYSTWMALCVSCAEFDWLCILFLKKDVKSCLLIRPKNDTFDGNVIKRGSKKWRTVWMNGEIDECLNFEIERAVVCFDGNTVRRIMIWIRIELTLKGRILIHWKPWGDPGFVHRYHMPDQWTTFCSFGGIFRNLTQCLWRWRKSIEGKKTVLRNLHREGRGMWKCMEFDFGLAFIFSITMYEFG